MSIVGNVSSPVITQSGDTLRETSAASLNDLGRGTQDTSNSSRTPKTDQMSTVRENSRTPRTTPSDVAAKNTEESRIARSTPDAVKVTISETAQAARTPSPVSVGEATGGLSVESGRIGTSPPPVGESTGNYDVGKNMDIAV
ncbi:MAG: hypothetical protein HQL71_05605 [Magnetococcales bacterium]|nr:hypothetical protein [Magnetococcales bacterium]